MLVKPKKHWLCPNMTEKLLTGTLSLNTNKPIKILIFALLKLSGNNSKFLRLPAPEQLVTLCCTCLRNLLRRLQLDAVHLFNGTRLTSMTIIYSKERGFCLRVKVWDTVVGILKIEMIKIWPSHANKSAAGMHDTPPRKFNLVQMHRLS